MPFQQGISGNPSGRPRGALNRKTKFEQAIADFGQEHVSKLLHVFYEAGIDGDVSAGKTFLEYVIPKADRRVEVEQDRPEFSQLSNAQLDAIADIIECKLL
jgi:hypothetical protein